jgi:hypothetical protein
VFSIVDNHRVAAFQVQLGNIDLVRVAVPLVYHHFAVDVHTHCIVGPGKQAIHAPLELDRPRPASRETIS